MAREEWRPGSFTKNFSWGTPDLGLKRLHEMIRIGFDEKLEDVPRAIFRARVQNAGRPVNNGPKTGVLPDFIVGAVAAAANVPLITANPDDFEGYFPDLQLISP